VLKSVKELGMTKTWQLKEAEAHFSKVIDEARKGQPQVLTESGAETVVILRYQDYEQLSNPSLSLWDALRPEAPILDEVDELFKRDKSVGREVNF
jgi:prevent-host-death family protein